MKKRGLAKSNFYKKLFHQQCYLISAAYHEAGHAIIGLLNFIKINSVESCIYKDRGIGGNTTFEVYPSSSDNIDILKYFALAELKVYYAGAIAEKQLLKNISGANLSPFFFKWGAKDDVKAAATLIKEFQLVPPGKKRYDFKQKVIKETNKLINEYWDDITLLSQFLYNKKFITYDDLKKLLCSKSKNNKFWKKQFKNIDIIFSNNFDLDLNTIKIMLGL